MPSFQQAFEQLLALCTEDYLIRHANKGLYNRAGKDIEKGLTVSYVFGDELVTCTLSDEHIVVLKERLDDFSCSCPSDKICKHVLAAILYYQQNHLGSVQAIKLDFSWLLAWDLTRIAACFKPVVLEDAIFRLDYPEEIIVSEGSLLTIRLAQQQVDVSFSEEEDPLKALCSVKTADAQLYILEAWLRYRALHHQESLEPLLLASKKSIIDIEVLAACRQLCAELLQVGLARLPRQMEERLEVLALAAHTAGLPDMEKELRGLSGELALFQARHLRFSLEGFKQRLTRLYMMATALQQDLPFMQQQQLIGSFKSRYFRLPALRLYGLGAVPWATQSGHKGITYYFAGLDKQQLYTFTDTRPMYYDQSSFDQQQFYERDAPWNSGQKMSSLIAKQFMLRQPKVSYARRISQSEETSFQAEERGNVEDVPLDYLLLDNREEATDESGHAVVMKQEDKHSVQVPDMFTKGQASLRLVSCEQILEVVFDEEGQELVMVAELTSGAVLRLTIPFQSERARLIQLLETNRSLREMRRFFILVQLNGDRALPISILQGKQLYNLLLDWKR